MDVEFWHQRWQENRIAFHLSEPHPMIVKHHEKLNLPSSSVLFLPLCGKTVDIAWLLSEGYQVVGIELSGIAVDQIFVDLKIEPQISNVGNLKRYSADGLNIYQGDFFDLTGEILGKVDSVYDRAALIALPQDMRFHYSEHLREITKLAPQLLITMEYDQNLVNGPPFSMNAAEVEQHYSNDYKIVLLESFDIPGGLKGKCEALEFAWLLQ